VQNLNLRHIYLIGFLIFGAVFARLASKFEKVLKNGSKKWKTFFYKHALEFNYVTINGLLHPSC
jgi:hypothetical protein